MIQDERGSLAVMESNRDVPFGISRVYYMFGLAPGTERGFHAHRALDQWAVCVAGSCTMVLDDGVCRREVVLDSPNRGLHVPPMVWHEMRDFSPDAVLMVLASAPYDEADYIRDYPAFLAALGQGVAR